MPNNPTWEETSETLTAPTWEDTTPEAQAQESPRTGLPSSYFETGLGIAVPGSLEGEAFKESGKGLMEPSLELPRFKPVSEKPASTIEKLLVGHSDVAKAFGPDVAVQGARSAINAAIGLPEFLTSPVGSASMVAGAVAPTAVAAGFFADTLKSAIEQGENLYDNWKTMTGPERMDALVNLGATGVLGTVLGKTAAKPFMPKPKPPVIPTAPVAEPIPKPEVTEAKPVPEPTPKPAEPVAVPETAKPALTPEQEALQPAAPPPEPAPIGAKPSLVDVIQVESVPATENGGRIAIVLPDGTAVVGGRIHADTWNRAIAQGVTTDAVMFDSKAGFVKPDGTAWGVNGEPLPKVSKVILVGSEQPKPPAKPEQRPPEPAKVAEVKPESVTEGEAKAKPMEGWPTSYSSPFHESYATRDLESYAGVWGGTAETRANYRTLLEKAVADKKPVSIRGWTTDLRNSPPEGYVREGEQFVYKPTPPPAVSPTEVKGKPVEQMTLPEVNEELGKIASELKDLGKGHVVGPTKKAMEAPLRDRQTRLFVQKQILEKPTPPQPSAGIEKQKAGEGKLPKFFGNMEAGEITETGAKVIGNFDRKKDAIATGGNVKGYLEGKYKRGWIATEKQPPTPGPGAQTVGETKAPEIRPGPGASTAADIAAESAAQSAGTRVASFINEGIRSEELPIKPTSKEAPIPESDLRSADPAVEQRWQDAKISKKTILQKTQEAIARSKNALTRHFKYLDPKTDGVVSDILRRHENDPLYSKYMASQVLRGVTANLTPKRYDLFSRIVILRDLAKYSEKLLRDKEDLPFGYQSIDAIKTDLARFEQTASKFPEIVDAVNRRDEFMDSLRYDLVSRELLPEQVKDFREYFHHQVLEYMAMKESPVASTGSQDVRTHKKGWQRKRLGSVKDFNTSYLESEFEVISQAFAQMATQDTLKQVKRVSDIAPELKETAKAMREEGRDVQWEQLIPKDHTIWQPVQGNHFYWANSLTDKTLESYFKGERDLTPEDVRKILALGGPRQQWVIPKRLAKTLDDFTPRQDTAIEKFLNQTQGQWKRWTLFNPMRNLIYELNNFSGDADISMAVDPKIFKYAPEAARELRKFVLQKKAGTQEMNELIKLGVIDSGFSVQELPDLKGNQFFSALTGEKPNLVQKYWTNVLDFNRWREGVLRYAAYQRALERIRSGEKIYWTSKKPEMDSMYADRNVTPEQIAAKLAREAIGDYGNVSAAGQWIRSKLMPFYSWMEINAPRYVRLFKNLPGEEKTRVAGIAGKRIAMAGSKLAARAGALYILANIWNKTMFPEEERQLGRTSNQFHIILGRNEDGSIRSLRFQGALSDALSWFGLENIIGDVQDVSDTSASLKDKAVQISKAPINKLINASLPLEKTIFEALVRRKTFPDVFNIRTVRDPGQHIAKLFSVGTVYDYLTNKPQRPGTWNPLSLATYTTDPGEAAYYAAKSLVSEYLEEHQREIPASIPTRRSNALYYYKQAVKYKDAKLQEYWKQKYFSLGGKEGGLSVSVSSSSPYHGVTSKKQDFLKSLSPAERQIMDEADKWYKKTYK